MKNREKPNLLILDEETRTRVGVVCGVDEAGRGPLAGPVFAAAVILPAGWCPEGLDDSKKLTPKKRELLFDEILQNAVSYGIASASHEEIDEINILQASFLAMNRAIGQLTVPFSLAMVDGNRVTGIEAPAEAFVGGDGRSASIAAASVLAKVSRDRFMQDAAKQYPQYGFDAHKGYGTRAHYEALREYGPCPLHRLTFLKKMH